MTTFFNTQYCRTCCNTMTAQSLTGRRRMWRADHHWYYISNVKSWSSLISYFQCGFQMLLRGDPIPQMHIPAVTLITLGFCSAHTVSLSGLWLGILSGSSMYLYMNMYVYMQKASTLLAFCSSWLVKFPSEKFIVSTEPQGTLHW